MIQKIKWKRNKNLVERTERIKLLQYRMPGTVNLQREKGSFG